MTKVRKLTPEELAEHHRAANRRYYWSHKPYFQKRAKDRRRRKKHDLSLAKRGLNILTMTADQLAAL